MKNIFSILILLMFNSIAIAQLGVEGIALNNNDFIYEQYAPRTDLTVAQIIDYPIDSNMFVNIIMLQADNDQAWLELKKEYKNILINPPEHETNSWCIDFRFMDHDHPTEIAPTYENGQVKILESCFVIAYYHLHYILLVYYNTIEEFDNLYYKLTNINFKL